MENTKDKGTVIRWSSFYAFARIIVIPKYADRDLFNTLTKLCEKEEDNGVKNQLLSRLNNLKQEKLQNLKKKQLKTH